MKAHFRIIPSSFVNDKSFRKIVEKRYSLRRDARLEAEELSQRYKIDVFVIKEILLTSTTVQSVEI